MQIKNKLFGLVLFAAMTLASQANAAEVLTTSLSGWEGTTTGSFAEWNFVFSGSTFNSAGGYTLGVGSYGPVTVTGPNGSGYSLTKVSYGSSNLTGLQSANNGVGSMVFVPPAAGLTAFGLGLGITGSAAPITVTLSDGEVFTASPTVGGTVFLGLSSATAINSLSLTTTSGSAVDLVDFFAGPSDEPATPTAPAAEVATALMIGSGLLFFGARRKVFSNLTRRHTSVKA